MDGIPDDDGNCTIEASFAVLELCLEQLVSIAPVGDANQLLDLIPSISLASQRLVLCELIKYDLSVASESGDRRTLDFYWPAVGGIVPQEHVPFDLVLEEVQLRRAAGESPNWSDYRQRFPDLADTIGKWLAGGQTEQITNPSTRVPELATDEQFDDFLVLKQLGQGAFARVYLARQVSMHRLVALKATARGSEEPQALSKLDHPNIVRVYDQRHVGEPPIILLYMQYLPGGTLADCIKSTRETTGEHGSGKLLLESIDRSLVEANQPPPEQSTIRNKIEQMDWSEVVAWIGIQLAEGLDYASRKGVLHRDVKPANILLSAEAIPKLADFNVSCSGISGRAGAAAHFGGSLAYMSPEQLAVADPTESRRADELDGRSDLYALGIVLWELWQGRRPWTLGDVAGSWTEAVQMQKDLRRREPEMERPACSATDRALEKVLRSLLQNSAEDRPQSGTETAARLRLAFYPDLAKRFEPSKTSFAGVLLMLPVLLLSAILIFGPNVVASRFNYLYNYHRMEDKALAMELSTAVAQEEQTTGTIALAVDRNQPAEASAPLPQASDSIPPSAGMWQSIRWIFIDEAMAGERPIAAHFRWTSYYVNIIVYILGLTLFWRIAWPFAKIVHRSKNGHSAKEKDIDYLWTIGYRATVVAFVLWCVSGFVFAASMRIAFPSSFTVLEDIHFFLSLILCGGVAWIYPFFGMTLLSLLVYYPKVVAPTMSDSGFHMRAEKIRRRSFWYLVSAAAIPLLATAALVLGDLHANWILTGVGMTAIGLIVAIYAHFKIENCARQFSLVLDSETDSLQV